ncbi:MAG: hypothetical protein Q4A82_07220 [Corynebacterium sp.]|nr:hypothetical protein [Corynebacterium sp.]
MVVDGLEHVRTTYGARAGEYIAAPGSIDHAAAPDLEFIAQWAHSINGPVLDVGCGPANGPSTSVT